MSQITDLIVFSKRLLVKDFGIKEDEADNLIGISLNVDNINIVDEKESIISYLEVFDNYIKCIKIHNDTYLNDVIDFIGDKNIPLFMQTKSDLEEVEKEYDRFQEKVANYLNEKGMDVKLTKKRELNNKGFSNIIIYTMIVLTLIIVVLMFIVKLR